MNLRGIHPWAFGMILVFVQGLIACGSGGGAPARGSAGAAGSAGSSGTGGSTSGPQEGCEMLEVGTLSPGAISGWVRAEATGKELANAFLQIEINSRPGHPLAEGSFDLSHEPDDDYASCAHCVVLMEGAEDPVDADRLFFAVDGTFVVDSPPSPPSSEWSGSISSVRLVEVELDPLTYQISPVNDGACFLVPEAAWDTHVPLGTSCTNAEECGDPSTKVCDPSTAECVEAACDGADAVCPSDQVCLAQSFESYVGACYDRCDPSDDGSCGVGRTCRTIHYDQTLGVCVDAGGAGEGEACERSDVKTGCEQGLECAAEFSGNVCRRQCDFLAVASTCPPAQVCVVGSFCSDGAVDPAPVDTHCDSAAPEANPCGLDNGIARGVCVLEQDASGMVMMCRRVCRMSEAADCSDGQTCHDYFGTAGICLAT